MFELSIVTIVLMIVYLIYSLSNLSRTEFVCRNLMYMSGGLIVLCLILAIGDFFSGNGIGFGWIFNAMLWALNFSLSKKQLDKCKE